MASFATVLASAACAEGDDSRWTNPPSGAAVISAPGLRQIQVKYEIGSAPHRSFDLSHLDIDLQLGSLSPEHLSTGGLVASNRVQLVFFNKDGSFAGTFGGQGEGPGEFSNIGAVCLTRGDTIVLEDRGRRQIAIVDGASRTIIRTFPNEFGRVSGHGCFPDGRFLSMLTSTDTSSGDRILTFLRTSLTGESTALLTLNYPRDRLRSGGYPRFVASGSDWILADPHFSEYRVYDTSGAVLRIVRIDEELIELTGLEALRAQGIDVAQGTQLPSDARLPTMRLPFFGSLRIGPDGTVWMSDRTQLDSTVQYWGQFDSGGRALGNLRHDRVALDQGFEIVGFGRNSVIYQHVSLEGIRLEEYALVGSDVR